MRDLVLFAHIIGGLSVMVFSIIIVLYLKKQAKWLKPLSIFTAFLSWLVILPSALLYLIFYPATKTVIKAGSWPWAHSIIMETKEHWGILLPIIATTAAWLVVSGKNEKSRKWWILLIILTLLIGVMGRLVKIGALK